MGYFFLMTKVKNIFKYINIKKLNKMWLLWHYMKIVLKKIKKRNSNLAMMKFNFFFLN